jgi:uracil-DNA glycosylase
MSHIETNQSWNPYLEPLFRKSEMQKLFDFLKVEREKKSIFPAEQDVFTAFRLTDFDQVKVVILGQDPYHGPGQAHGLSFSVPPETALPPSLRNIFKELATDLQIEMPKTGNLTKWAEQGVLLLNSVLTVEAGKPGSHQGKGWEEFTDEVIRILSQERENLVFILWGSYAHKKGQIIDRKKHLVIESPHPSPLSAYRGFFGTKPFSKVNQYLQSQENQEIQWNL